MDILAKVHVQHVFKDDFIVHVISKKLLFMYVVIADSSVAMRLGLVVKSHIANYVNIMMSHIDTLVNVQFINVVGIANPNANTLVVDNGAKSNVIVSRAIKSARDALNANIIAMEFVVNLVLIV